MTGAHSHKKTEFEKKDSSKDTDHKSHEDRKSSGKDIDRKPGKDNERKGSGKDTDRLYSKDGERKGSGKDAERLAVRDAERKGSGKESERRNMIKENGERKGSGKEYDRNKLHSKVHHSRSKSDSVTGQWWVWNFGGYDESNKFAKIPCSYSLSIIFQSSFDKKFKLMKGQYFTELTFKKNLFHSQVVIKSLKGRL